MSPTAKTTTTNDPLKIMSSIFISFIGAGVLGLPFAFKEAGLLEGLLIMIAVSLCSIKAMLILIDCKYQILSRTTKDRNGSLYMELPLEEVDENGSNGDDGSINGGHDDVSYSDVGYAALGRKGRFAIDITLLVSQIGFCCAYLIFISETMTSYIPSVDKTQWLILILPPLLLLTLIPDLGRLASFSLFAQISNLLAFAVVFWFDFDHLHLASNEHRKEFSVKGFPFFFSVAIYCFEGAGMILSIEAAVSSELKSQFRNIFVKTILGVTALYVTFGASGYLSYGKETKDIITLNLPHSSTSFINSSTLVKMCLCLGLFFTYPVMLIPVTSLLEKKMMKLATSSNKSTFYVLVRLFLVTLTGLIVIAVPRFADLMALVGASCCTLLAFIMPGICHLILFGKDLSKKEMMTDYVLIGVGSVGAVLGTLDALKKVTS